MFVDLPLKKLPKFIIGSDNCSFGFLIIQYVDANSERNFGSLLNLQSHPLVVGRMDGRSYLHSRFGMSMPIKTEKMVDINHKHSEI